MIHNIPLSLDRDFELSLQELAIKYGENFEILNGLHQSQLDFSEFIEGFIDKNTADVTIDSNANASRSKDVRSLLVEQTKSQNKLFSFNKIFYEMKKAYGLKVAKQWLEQEWVGAFYLHDASSASLLPYCYAMSLERMAKEGLFFLNQYKIEPPKHLTTYFDDVLETVSYFSNLSSGAFGMPDLLLWAFYYWKKDINNGYYLKDPIYYAKQNMQKLIYRLNQPYLRVTQTSFTNVSLFDRNYYEALFGGTVFPDGTYAIDYMEEFIEFEKLFMTVLNEIRDQNVFAFPVTTICLLYKDGEFKDKEFARWMSDANSKYFIANFFQSNNTATLSNCCFSYDTVVKLKFEEDGPEMEMQFDEAYSKFSDLRENHPGSKVYVFYEGKYVPAEVIVLPRVTNMYKIVYGNENEIVVTADHIHCTNNGEKKTSELTMNDKLRVYIDGCVMYLDIKSISLIYDTTYYDYVYCFKVDSEDQLFTLANGLTTHNCRLLSDTSKLNAFINSIGGTALSIGSVKVNTINLRKIAYEVFEKYYKDASEFAEIEYLKILRERAEMCCKLLKVQRHIISRNIEKGLLPNFCKGGVEIEKCYSTLGIVGLFEVMSAFGYIKEDEFGNKFYTPKADNFASKIFEVLNDVKDHFECDYSMNIESVPAERAAVILCQKDNLLYGNNDNYIYSSQWIPLSEKCTFNEKLRVSSLLDAKCSGGSIAHINVEAPFPNTDVAWDLLNHIAKSNVFYFAFNAKLNQCENKHTFFGTDICPVCGKRIKDVYTRIIGYCVPIESFSKERHREFDSRRWYEYAQMKQD